jgi:signal transduction histidine kinase
MMSEEFAAGDRRANPRLTVRAAERELALEDLAYLNRMTTVGQVLPNVAHELNNALQVIGGIVEMLSMRTELAADVRDKVGRIGVQSSRASDMVRELVSFARREDAGIALVDVVKVVERALAFRRYHLARARVAVSIEGDVARPVLCRVDPSDVRQILLNLLINAEHSLTGRTDGRIQIEVTRRADTIRIRVADNGGGLSDALVPRVIEPFFTTKMSAAGLGLTVAAGLARAQNGQLTLGSADGWTEVVLALPAAAGR